MIENVYDRINDYGSVKISLASPNDIRSWSYGEVRKPETINYRTYRAEKDGLFCERIFGPERDWECFCGKYKGTKHKGMICDRCGVKVTHSRVRRKRMGHINLAAPIVHIWFFKAMPSRLGALLDMKTSDLEKVVYFQDYVIVEPGDTPLKERQILSEDEYRQALEKYGTAFEAQIGAEAVKKLLQKLELNSLSVELREAIGNTNSKQKIKDLSKRLKIVESLRHSSNEATWMVMDVIPVIPPDLRPLVLLESGNFATSDLNDLYRRIINRNNRLKKLIDLNAPEVIIRNEKRMLQQAVDALFDNGRCRRPVLGSSNRPLKSMTDMIKGKQGRFRENLLGKRVDYSARSVIVIGPDLGLHQCGLPKRIALELYQPFIIRKLKERGLADTIKSAKKMLERRDQEIWDILEEVIHQHPVMLNRAPTLHRMGIQAFEPVLVEGNAIKIHPLVCRGFNADFDGDQMAVHLPLSIEAQAEAHILMLATNNIFSPASGSPIMSPSQDIVMGIFYLTCDHHKEPTKPEAKRVFTTATEAIMAFEVGKLGIHEPIRVRITRSTMVTNQKSLKEPSPKNRIIETTVGRLIFNDMLHPDMPYYNYPLSSKGASRVIADCYEILGRSHTIDLLDSIKQIGFKWSTTAGLSFGLTDMRIPEKKKLIIDGAQKKVDRILRAYQHGQITDLERYNALIDIWVHVREQVTEAMMAEFKSDFRDKEGHYVQSTDEGAIKYLNPIYLMSDSGARGSVDQIRQLAGMRALMAKPSGEIIETPIKANFREGLSVLEYFSSTHGARKGLADTALKTADSGYLTRKLADVAQNLIVSMVDCGTIKGITKGAQYKGEEVDIPLADSIVGRVARDTIKHPVTDETIVKENQIITTQIARRIEGAPDQGGLGLDRIRVRSPLTCESPVGVCARCYGMDMSSGQLVECGMAVGIIAAQSIGEPGTQLTMRTFHTGGVASRAVIDSNIASVNAGTVAFHSLNAVPFTDPETQVACLIVLKRNGELAINDDKGRELEKHKIPYGARIMVKEGEQIERRAILCEWDPHLTPILAEAAGQIRFQDVVEGETVRIDSEAKGKSRYVVVEHRGDKNPQVIIEDKDGKILEYHYLPAKARIEVAEGDSVKAGSLLARRPRELSGTQDITGGLPRVTELFEARKPKEPAVMSEISGTVEIRSDKRRGKMTIIVNPDSKDLESREHHVPQDKHLLVHAGDHVDAGDPLCDGPLVPHDILAIKGEDDLHTYLIKEVQSVYRSQNVGINDKHIETILSQMLRKVKIDNPGDSNLLPGEVADRHRFQAINMALAKSVRITDPGDSEYIEGQIVSKDELSVTNEKLDDEGKDPAKGRKPKPATASTQLLGITKAALQSDSFISAASFQETTKVLTEAALGSQSDFLTGLKENVILGHLIPAGTAFKPYQDMFVAHMGNPIEEETREVQMPGAGTMAGMAEAEAAAAEAVMPRAAMGEMKRVLDSGAPIGPAPMDDQAGGGGVSAGEQQN
ncbi:MAG: DNA-directed RNA polymerase subunit beta' [Phycisphaerales bacterium]|nr:DNA-directed RNA polymerase subunit beta' [Phycisphaerales bacterium]MCB9854791.1 DNA-directed RNA polymerase subunit beta' [Phycisphaerales bacterium]MCB9863737.1 DNA-directed RNA polymerase subunit beta' [Phycisphaerales bacterium]